MYESYLMPYDMIHISLWWFVQSQDVFQEKGVPRALQFTTRKHGFPGK